MIPLRSFFLSPQWHTLAPCGTGPGGGDGGGAALSFLCALARWSGVSPFFPAPSAASLSPPSRTSFSQLVCFRVVSAALGWASRGHPERPATITFASRPLVRLEPFLFAMSGLTVSLTLSAALGLPLRAFLCSAAALRRLTTSSAAASAAQSKKATAEEAKKVAPVSSRSCVRPPTAAPSRSTARGDEVVVGLLFSLQLPLPLALPLPLPLALVVGAPMPPPVTWGGRGVALPA
jgi:hypothetical protein